MKALRSRQAKARCVEQDELEGSGENVWDEVRDRGKITLALVGYGRESGFYFECVWMDVFQSSEQGGNMF